MILDRSTIERFAECPQQGYLTLIRSILIAGSKMEKIEPWEEELLKDADTVKLMEPTIYQAETDELREVGIEVHQIIKKAFIECDNDLDKVPDWLVEKLPEARPDIQPKVIKAARYICDMICNLHVNVLAAEKQFDIVLLPAIKDREEVIATMCYDLICQGLNQTIHVIDWKGGYKKRTNSETADSFQAQFGAWLLWSQPEYAHVETIYWWYYETRFGTRSFARFDRDSEHPRLPHLTTFVAIDARVRNVVKIFLDGNRECWPTEKKCCWCGMIKWCKLTHLNANEIADDPKAFIDNLVVDIESVSKRKKAATEWIKSKGQIEGTNMMFDRKPPSNKFIVELKEKTNHLLPVEDEELENHFK